MSSSAHAGRPLHRSRPRRHSVLDLFLDLLSLLVGVRLGGLALTLDELLGGLLSLSDALLDLPSRLALDFLDAGLTPLAHLARAVGALLGHPRGLDCSLLGLPRALRGVAPAPRADVNGVANRCGVDHGGRHLSPLVARAGGDILKCLSRFQRSGHEPNGIRRHLPVIQFAFAQTSASSFRRKHANSVPRVPFPSLMKTSRVAPQTTSSEREANPTGLPALVAVLVGAAAVRASRTSCWARCPIA